MLKLSNALFYGHLTLMALAALAPGISGLI